MHPKLLRLAVFGPTREAGTGLRGVSVGGESDARPVPKQPSDLPHTALHCLNAEILLIMCLRSEPRWCSVSPLSLEQHLPTALCDGLYEHSRVPKQ